MSRLTRDGTAKPVSRNHFFGVDGDNEFFPWSADYVKRIVNLPVDFYSAICDDNNNNNYNCCSVYPQLLPVIGAPWGLCGREFIFPVDYSSEDVQLTRLRRLNQGTLTSICARKNLNATVVQFTCTREFFFSSCTGIRRSGKTCLYKTAVVVLIFCVVFEHTLYRTW